MVTTRWRWHSIVESVLGYAVPFRDAARPGKERRTLAELGEDFFEGAGGGAGVFFAELG